MGNPRSAGIYSVLIMSKDQANITEGKYVVLDPAQKMVIEKVAENQPKNVFLWGSSGCRFMKTRSLCRTVFDSTFTDVHTDRQKLDVILGIKLIQF